MKRHIPNIITALRIVLCVPMLCAEAMSPLFLSCYLLAGITDMLDGFLARRLGVVSDFGSRLDSIADVIFVVTAFVKLFPVIELPHWIWLIIIIIAVIKVASISVSKIRIVKIVFLHTIPNKLTGLLLFLGMFFVEMPYFQYVVIGISVFAMFAAIDELVKICNKN